MSNKKETNTGKIVGYFNGEFKSQMKQHQNSDKRWIHILSFRDMFLVQ